MPARKIREQDKKVYKRPALWAQDAETVEAIAETSNWMLVDLYHLAVQSLMRPDETPAQAGRRIARGQKETV